MNARGAILDETTGQGGSGVDLDRDSSTGELAVAVPHDHVPDGGTRFRIHLEPAPAQIVEVRRGAEIGLGRHESVDDREAVHHRSRTLASIDEERAGGRAEVGLDIDDGLLGAGFRHQHDVLAVEAEGPVPGTGVDARCDEHCVADLCRDDSVVDGRKLQRDAEGGAGTKGRAREGQDHAGNESVAHAHQANTLPRFGGIEFGHPSRNSAHARP